MQRNPRTQIIILLTAVVPAMIGSGCAMHQQSSGSAAAETPPTPVSVLTASGGVMNQTLPVIGQLQSDNRVTLTTKISGRLVRLGANEGDRVSTGELVAELDDTDQLSSLAQAQASLDGARTHYDQTRTGVNLKDVQTSVAIRSAKANLDAARAKLKQTITAAKIADTEADTGVQQAKANLASAQQNLDQVKEGSRVQEKAQADLAVQNAQDSLVHAQDNFNRLDTLLKQGAVSQLSVDDAKYTLDQAKTALNTAKQQQSLVQEGSRTQQVRIAEAQVRQATAALDQAVSEVQRRSMSRDDVTQAQQQVQQLEAQLSAASAGTAQYTMTRQDVQVAAAQVAQAQAAVQMADQQLKDTRIYSPVSGIVDTRPATIGGSVSPTTVLMTIMPTRGVYFEADVPENAISSVHIGDPVTTTVDALPGKAFTGRISEIIPVADTSSKLYRVHISIPDANGALPQNGFARGSIVVAQVHGIIVPKDSIVTTVGDTYVWVIQGGHARQRYIHIGMMNDTRAQVISGLEPGDRYITAGKDSVIDGAAVTVEPDVRPAS